MTDADRLLDLMTSAVRGAGDDAPTAIRRFEASLLALRDVALVWEMFEAVRPVVLRRLHARAVWLLAHPDSSPSAAQDATDTQMLRQQSDGEDDFLAGSSPSAVPSSRDTRARGQQPDGEDVFIDSSLIAAQRLPESHCSRKQSIEEEPLSADGEPQECPIPQIRSSALPSAEGYPREVIFTRPARDAASARRAVRQLSEALTIFDRLTNDRGIKLGELTPAALEDWADRTPLLQAYAKALRSQLPMSDRPRDAIRNLISAEDAERIWNVINDRFAA